MKQIRKNILRIAWALLALFLLLAVYGAFSIATTGNRWFSSSANTFARSKRQNVIPGDILDRNGVILAHTDETGERQYQENELNRRATVHVVGDRGNNVKNSAESFLANYLYGFNMTFLERLSFAIRGEKPQGDTVQLTIDSNLAAYVAQIFPTGKAGAVVVMNYKTGEVLTLQSFPNYDPNDVASSVRNDSRGPFTNRAVQWLSAPGSTFKIVTAAAAIQNFSDYDTRVFQCDGQLTLGNRVITDAGTNLAEDKLTMHGEITLARAFQVSCNNTFARIALQLGDSRLRKTAESFGFNDNFLFRDLVVYNSRYPTENRSEGEIAWTGAGQSALAASPLHMCLIAGAVANDGVMMEPRLLLSVTSCAGVQRTGFSARVYRKPLTEAQAEILTEYMRSVVAAGTGTAADLEGVKVCGKTGSAELDNQEQTNAWFVGFLDEENSPYVLAVVVENAGGGGSVAAPIARQIFSWLLSHGYDR